MRKVRKGIICRYFVSSLAPLSGRRPCRDTRSYPQIPGGLCRWSAAIGQRYSRLVLYVDGGCSAAQLAANHETSTVAAVACTMLGDLLHAIPWAKAYATGVGIACAFGGSHSAPGSSRSPSESRQRASPSQASVYSSRPKGSRPEISGPRFPADEATRASRTFPSPITGLRRPRKSKASRGHRGVGDCADAGQSTGSSGYLYRDGAKDLCNRLLRRARRTGLLNPG
jgi:hypothetical protein